MVQLMNLIFFQIFNKSCPRCQMLSSAFNEGKTVELFSYDMLIRLKGLHVLFVYCLPFIKAVMCVIDRRLISSVS